MWCSGYKVRDLIKRMFYIIHKYQSDPSQSELQVAEVKICSSVSHGIKALPSILEIAQEFWP